MFRAEKTTPSGLLLRSIARQRKEAIKRAI
jgi:hypothetical protein